MIKSTCFLILSLVLLSCGGEGVERIKLSHHQVATSDLILGSWLKIENDHLIAFDSYTDHNIVTTLHKNDFSLIAQFGKKGDGPQEISQPGFFTTSNDSIHIYDAGKKNIITYSMEGRGANSKHLPKSVPLLSHFHRTGSGYYVSQNFATPQEYSFVAFNYSEKSDSVRFFGDPFYTEDPVKTDYYRQYHFFSDVHPHKILLIRAYNFYDVIQLLNEEGNLIHEYKGPQFKPYQPSVYYYGNITVSEKYIYSLYYGLNRVSENGLIPAKEIRVFDWQLQPVAVLELDVPVITFDLDTDNHRLVAFQALEEENPICWFPFHEDQLKP